MPVHSELLARRPLKDRLFVTAPEEGAEADKDDLGVCK